MDDDRKPGMSWPGPPPEFNLFQRIVFWILVGLVAWLGVLVLVAILWGLAALTLAVIGGIFG